MPGSTGDGIDISEIRELEERLSKFRIETSPDMTIRGNAWQGFALNTYTCDEIPESQGGGGHGPPIPTGACCYGTTCNVVSGVYCAITGGTYHGDGSPCSPNPCAEPSTSRCCLPDHSCADLTESDCTDAGGAFIPGTSCDDSACSCCGNPLVWQGCFDGINARTGPEQCDDPTCLGEIVTDITNWYTDIEYCLDCPGSALTLNCTSEVDPVTCVFTQTGPCTDCSSHSGGGTHEMQNQVPSCLSLLSAFDSPFFRNN